MKKQGITVGILTFNSEASLPRALRSLPEGSEILIADGGSSDSTLSIARSFGARVMSQSHPGQPIVDFALERNRLLDATETEWFFYLDSDEVMSPELSRWIIEQVISGTSPVVAYRVRYLKTSTDTTKRYRTFKEYYQLRLVRTDVAAHFERPIHERIVVPASVIVGQTEYPWLVPLEAEDLKFRFFAKKAWKRAALQAAAWHPSGVGQVLERRFITPIVSIAKSVVKMIVVKLRFWNEAIPLRYELLRILYALFLSVQNARRFVRWTVSAK